MTNDGGGVVDANANTITLDFAMDGEVSYELTAPDVCEGVVLAGKITGCDTSALGDDVRGDSALRCLVLGSPPFLFDFDTTGPTTPEEVLNYFDVLGVDGEWTIAQNAVNPANGTNALFTGSNDGQLENYFSRVLLLAGFEIDDVEVCADITWADNDWSGIYVRFSGNSDDPLGNDYYFLRVVGNGEAGGVRLDRVKGGVREELARGGPPVAENDTITLCFRAEQDALFASVNGTPVDGMNPFFDPDPILGAGRVGVGQNTNPSYYDNLEIRPREVFLLSNCDAQITYFKGTEEASPAADGTPTADWAQAGFDDSTWLQGQLGIGYGDGDDVTVLDDMRNNYSTVYVRTVFSLASADLPFGVTTLRADYDDGFLAYLNGVEIVRTEGIEATPPAFNAPSGGHGASERPDSCAVIDDGHEDVVDFPVETSLLQEGENVLGVHVFNSSAGSSDVSFTAKLFHEETSTALACFREVTCGFNLTDCESVTLNWTNVLASYDAIEISRNGEMIASLAGDQETYTDAEAPLGVNVYGVVAIVEGTPCPSIECSAAVGAVIASVLPGDEWRFIRGREEPSPAEDGSATVGWTQIDFDDAAWDTGQSGFGYGDDDDMTLLDDMEDSYISVYIRKTVDVPAELLAAIAEVIIGVDYDDAFVCYVNGVEVGRDNLDGTPPPFDASATDTHGSALDDGTREVLAFFAVDRALLVAGPNVIAVQGHNAGISSSDFSLIPESYAVLNVANAAPTVNISASPSEKVELPPDGITQVTLDGSGSTDDGLGCGRGDITYSWTKVSGPEGDNMISPSAVSTIVTFSQLGTYEYQLAVSDGGDTGTAVVAITVVPAGRGKVPGDANGDGMLNISDLTYYSTLLFVDSTVPLPCGGPLDAFNQGGNLAVLDFNGDGGVDISDILANALWQFSGGAPHPLNMSAEGGAGCALISHCGDVDHCAP